MSNFPVGHEFSNPIEPLLLRVERKLNERSDRKKEEKKKREEQESQGITEPGSDHGGAGADDAGNAAHNDDVKTGESEKKGKLKGLFGRDQDAHVS